MLGQQKQLGLIEQNLWNLWNSITYLFLEEINILKNFPNGSNDIKWQNAYDTIARYLYSSDLNIQPQLPGTEPSSLSYRLLITTADGSVTVDMRGKNGLGALRSNRENNFNASKAKPVNENHNTRPPIIRALNSLNFQSPEFELKTSLSTKIKEIRCSHRLSSNYEINDGVLSLSTNPPLPNKYMWGMRTDGEGGDGADSTSDNEDLESKEDGGCGCGDN